jgi:hypothetical protein
VPRSFDATAGAEINEAQPGLGLQSIMASDGIAPLGVAAIDNNVTRVERLGRKLVEKFINDRTSGNVQEDYQWPLGKC